MAYGRYRRRRSYRTRRSRGGGWLSTAKRALRVANYVRSLVNVEYKHKDATVPFSAVPVAGSFYFLTGIPEGDDSFSRNGRSILAKSSFLNGFVQIPPEADGGASSVICRIILFQDQSNNGLAPTVGELLNNTGSPLTSPLNTDNAGNRFRIYQDKRMALTSNTQKEEWFKSYINLHHHLAYDGTTDTIADAVTGHLWLWAYFGVQSGETSNQVNWEWTHRLMYIDN